MLEDGTYPEVWLLVGSHVSVFMHPLNLSYEFLCVA